MEKPCCTPEFRSFRDYYEFMCETTDAIGQNLTDPRRRYRISPVTTISSGYDSAAISVFAKRLGCRRAWSLTSAITMFFFKNDSGRAAGQVLGLDVKEVQRKRSRFRDEELIWAGNGFSESIALTLFDYDDDLTFLFTGNHAGILWNKARHHAAYLHRSDVAGSGLTEYRLHKGIIQCPLAFSGISRAQQVEDISFLDEMRPWTLQRKRYNRPIARRILEEAGVPRHTFGMKKAAVSPWVVFWATDKAKSRELAEFLRKNGFRVVFTWGPFQGFVDSVKMASHAIGSKFLKFSPIRGNYYHYPQNGHLLWALEHLGQQYRTGSR
jgi:hypothetical protein